MKKKILEMVSHKRQDTTATVIPCLYLLLFTVLRTLAVGLPVNKKRTRALSHRESDSGTSCVAEHSQRHLNLQIACSTSIQSASAFRKESFPPITFIVFQNIRKRICRIKNLPEGSTSLPGAGSQCGTLHLDRCASFRPAILHHILRFPEEAIRCLCNTLPERNFLRKKSPLDSIPDIFIKLNRAGCGKIMIRGPLVP